MGEARDCSGIENDLALFVGGDLDRNASLEIGQHLRGCRSCAEAVDRLAASRAALRAGLERDEARVPDLWPAVRARLQESGTIHPSPAIPTSPVAAATPRRNWRWMPISAAAAALLAVGLWLMNPADESGPRSGAGDSIARSSAPLQVQPVGLRRLEPGESALSNSATSIDALQEELLMRSSAGQPAGAQTASQHRGLH